MTQNIDINMTAKPSVNLFYENFKNFLFKENSSPLKKPRFYNSLGLEIIFR